MAEKVSKERSSKLNGLARVLRETWPHGTISLAVSDKCTRPFTVWLHRGHSCVNGFGRTADEALDEALAKARTELPDQITAARKAVEDARRALEMAEADAASLVQAA